MAVKQDRDGKLMLYDNIPLDDATIARLLYKTEKAIEACMQLLTEFHLIAQSIGRSVFHCRNAEQSEEELPSD